VTQRKDDVKDFWAESEDAVVELMGGRAKLSY